MTSRTRNLSIIAAMVLVLAGAASDHRDQGDRARARPARRRRARLRGAPGHSPVTASHPREHRRRDRDDPQAHRRARRLRARDPASRAPTRSRSASPTSRTPSARRSRWAPPPSCSSTTSSPTCWATAGPTIRSAGPRRSTRRCEAGVEGKGQGGAHRPAPERREREGQGALRRRREGDPGVLRPRERLRGRQVLPLRSRPTARSPAPTRAARSCSPTSRASRVPTAPTAPIPKGSECEEELKKIPEGRGRGRVRAVAARQDTRPARWAAACSKVPQGVVVVEAERAPNQPETRATATTCFEDDSELSGSDIENPEQNTDQQTQEPIVTMEFTDEGSRGVRDGHQADRGAQRRDHRAPAARHVRRGTPEPAPALRDHARQRDRLDRDDRQPREPRGHRRPHRGADQRHRQTSSRPRSWRSSCASARCRSTSS